MKFEIPTGKSIFIEPCNNRIRIIRIPKEEKKQGAIFVPSDLQDEMNNEQELVLVEENCLVNDEFIAERFKEFRGDKIYAIVEKRFIEEFVINGKTYSCIVKNAVTALLNVLEDKEIVV